jgi:hypothetical protein
LKKVLNKRLRVPRLFGLKGLGCFGEAWRKRGRPGLLPGPPHAHNTHARAPRTPTPLLTSPHTPHTQAHAHAHRHKSTAHQKQKQLRQGGFDPCPKPAIFTPALLGAHTTRVCQWPGVRPIPEGAWWRLHAQGARTSEKRRNIFNVVSPLHVGADVDGVDTSQAVRAS